MTNNLRKMLLAGAAVMAVGSLGAAKASAANLDLNASDVWADGGAGPLGPAAAGDNVDISANAATMDITNDGVNDDGSIDTNTFSLGDVTDSSGAADGSISVYQDAAGGYLDVTINSADIGGSFTLDNNDGAALGARVSIANDLLIGGDLSVTNNDTDGDLNEVELFVTGGLTVGGTVYLTSGDGYAMLDVDGDINVTSGMVLDASGGANVDIVLDAATAQVVNSDITGANGSDGTFHIANTNAAGVTFNGFVGSSGSEIESITLDTTLGNVLTVFMDDVWTANGITLGGGVANDATVTFDTSVNDIDMVGVIDGDGTATANINITGGGTVNQANDWGLGTTIDTIDIAAGTELAADAGITATLIQLHTGSILLSTWANTFTADIEGGSGTLDIQTGNTVVVGNIGATTALADIIVEDSATLTIDADTANADLEVNATTGILLDDDDVDNGSGGGLEFDASGQTITVGAAITTGFDGEGAIDVSGDAGRVDFTADIGSATFALQDLIVADLAGASVVTTTSDLYVDSIVLNTSDELRFLGDGVSQVVSGTIAGGAANRGSLIIGDGVTVTDVLFMSVLGGGGNTLSALTINADAAAAFGADATFAGAFLNDGTAEIAAGNTLSVASFNAASTGVMEFEVDRTAGVLSGGVLDISGGGALDLSNGSILISVASGSGSLVDGETLMLTTGSSALTLPGSTDILDESALYDFLLTDVGNNIQLEVDSSSALQAAASTPGNLNAGEVLLNDLAGSADPEINLIQDALAAATTNEEIDEILEATQPPVDGGVFTGAMSFMSDSVNAMDNRLAALRTGSETGMAAGDVTQGVHWWAQVFGHAGNQDRRDGIDGYDSRTFGGAVGVDTENISRGIVGAAFSYGSTNVDSDNANATETDVDSYQFTLYGDYGFDHDVFINGMIAYTYNQADTTRHNVGGIAGATAFGDYDASQYTLRARLGQNFDHSGAVLTPSVLAHWTHFDPDSYSETGTAGGAGLRDVDMDSMNIFEVGVGLDASWNLMQSDGSVFKPRLNIGYRYDFVGDRIQTTSQFAAGGPAFDSQGADPAQGTFDAGAALSLDTTSNWDFTVDYDFEAKSDYTAHSGFVRLGYKF